MSQDLVHTDLEKQAEQKLFGVLKKYQRSLEQVLPKMLTPERFTWLVINNIRTTPALLQCTPQSFINSVMLASNMGLEIRRNSAYLVPFGKECNLLVDYRGKLDIARRSGKVGAIALEPVYEGDVFEYERTGKGIHFRHKPLLWNSRNGRMEMVPEADRGEIVLGYSLAQLVGHDEPQIDIMTLAQVEAIRRRAKTGCAQSVEHYGKTYPALSLADIRKLDWQALPFRHPYRVPWVTDYNQQFRKTLAHRGANYWPQSSELVLSQEVDDSETTGKQPLASGLEEFTAVLDPADNQPLVEIPETAEKQKDAAQAVAQQKITELQKRGRGKAAAEQLAETVMPEYTRETLPDAFNVPVGSKCKYEGKTLECIEEPGEAPKWKTLDEPGKRAADRFWEGKTG